MLYFVTREKELINIYIMLNVDNSQRTVILHGMGRVGKIQVTITYAK